MLLAAYLIGSVSFGVVVSKLMGLADPHTYGSGNPGATNVLRTGNKKAALFTLLGDVGKGVLAVLLARWLAPSLGLSDMIIMLVGLAAFIGHLYPVFHGFKGGKGVATAGGVLLALNPLHGLAVLATWLAVALALVLGGALGEDDPSLPPLPRVPLAGGTHRTRDRGRGTGENRADAESLCGFLRAGTRNSGGARSEDR